MPQELKPFWSISIHGTMIEKRYAVSWTDKTITYQVYADSPAQTVRIARESAGYRIFETEQKAKDAVRVQLERRRENYFGEINQLGETLRKLHNGTFKIYDSFQYPSSSSSGPIEV